MALGKLDGSQCHLRARLCRGAVSIQVVQSLRIVDGPQQGVVGGQFAAQPARFVQQSAIPHERHALVHAQRVFRARLVHQEPQNLIRLVRKRVGTFMLRKWFAGEVVHLQRARDADRVRGRHTLGIGGIHPAQPVVQRGPPQAAGLLHQRRAEAIIPGRQFHHPVKQGAQVEARSTLHHQGNVACVCICNDRGTGRAELGRIKRLVHLHQVHTMVGDVRALFWRGLGRSHIQAAVDLPAVHHQHLAAKALRQRQGQRAFSRGRGPRQHHQLGFHACGVVGMRLQRQGLMAVPPAGRTGGMSSRKHFVAMAGNIGSGKTTAAKLVSRKFGFELFDEPVVDNRFLKDYYADMRRWSFTLQLEFLIRRAEHHEIIRTVNKSCIQDRTLYEDPEIFAKYLHGLGHMQDRELELYFEYFHRINKGLQLPDKIIFIGVPHVETLLRRIRERGRAEESAMATDFLVGLNAYYSTFPQVCRQKYGVQVLEWDGTQDDIRSGPAQERFLDTVSTFLQA